MHVRQNSETNQSGFSLLEAIIGMAVIGILITALYSALSSGFATEQLDREDFRATQIMIEKMDQLRVISWEELLDPTITPTSFDAAFNPDETPALRKRNLPLGLANGLGLGLGATNAVDNGHNKYQSLVYSGTLEISDAPADTTYSADMRQVKVTLQWKTLSGMKRTRSFTTFVARYGIQNYKY